MNGADLIAAILKREGVEWIPAFPHSDIIDSAARIGVRPLIVRQERHALHMADGVARVTGGKKICATTVQYGPGSENAIGALAQCYADNVPVLHIPGGYPRDQQGVRPNFNASRIATSFTKHSEFAYQADRIPQMMQHAFAMLRNGRPGPVMLEVPIDIFTEEVSPELLDTYKVQNASTSMAAEEDMRLLIDALKKAQHPVIVAGQGILYSGASRELVELAESTGVPVMTTLNGKSAFPEQHPLSLGCGGGARPDPLVEFLRQADLVVGLGTSFTHSDYITPLPTHGVRYIQLTNFDGDIAKDYPIDHALIGDARTTLAGINTLIRDQIAIGVEFERKEIVNDLSLMRARFEAEWKPLLTSEQTPINPYRVIHDVMQCVDLENTIVTHEAGSPRDQITPFWECRVPNSYIGWGKTTQLGMSLGLIQGAKLARPDATCINIMGDAAIGMTGMDFETAVRNELGTLTVVLKNSVMGGYTDYHPAAAEKYRIHELGGNYADFARSMGGHGERVSEPAEIIPAVKRALARNAEGIPALLEVITGEEKRMPRKLPV